MRILMLSDMYPPYIGGVEQHVRNLSRGLTQRGHAVTVVSMHHPERAEVADEDGVRVHRLRSTAWRATSLLGMGGRPYSPPLPDPAVMRSLRRIIKADRPEIIHAHNWMVDSVVPLKAWSKARLVLTLHGYDMTCAKRSLMYYSRECTGPGFSKCLRCAASNYGAAKGMTITIGNWLTRGGRRSAVDMFLPVSHAVAVGNDLERLRLPFQVLPNFVPDDVAQASAPSDYGSLLPEGPFCLFVGALRPHKGINVLLQAYNRLEGAPPLVVIGTKWSDTPRRFPPKVIVQEDVPHAAVMAAWRRATIGIVPSVAPDPCPTVALEAMASGVPLVASRNGGLSEMVDDGATGLLVEPGDADQLRRALITLLDDEAMRRRMGEAAQRRAVSFMATTVIDRLEGIYRQLATGAA
ncbi:MAG: glycosyltransferase family 4 protein [Chloroflexota bacterium]